LIRPTETVENRALETVQFLSQNTPDFISPLMWPPNSPNLNPDDYKVWGVLRRRLYRTRIRDFDRLKQRQSKNCVTSVRTSSTEQWDSGVLDCVLVSVKTAAILNTSC